MNKKANNTFFTEDVYQTEIRLDVNQDVLERIFSDNVSESDEYPVEFFFVTDKVQKANFLKDFLEANYPNYSELRVQPYEDLYEVVGSTNPIPMQLETINGWNKEMWDIGYNFDCKLNG
ncbi:MAG TPA: ribonuclease E inhibitor RraB, partial [Segetibacter sp.]|nr:ribonuclease E inhibitor RraB [Segetibacter sp.]